MANEINRIGINSGLVNPYGNQPKGGDLPPQGDVPDTGAAAPATPQVRPDDVFTYMAGTASVNRPQAYDVRRYVSPESAARIAAMMGDFEDAVTQGLLVIENEGLPLSEDAKLALAAEMVG